jgi:hypothetical protein
MLTLLWDAQGPIMEPYQERGTTINSVRYSEMLRDQLKPTTGTQRRELLSQSIASLHYV